MPISWDGCQSIFLPCAKLHDCWSVYGCFEQRLQFRRLCRKWIWSCSALHSSRTSSCQVLSCRKNSRSESLSWKCADRENLPSNRMPERVRFSSHPRSSRLLWAPASIWNCVFPFVECRMQWISCVSPSPGVTSCSYWIQPYYVKHHRELLVYFAAFRPGFTGDVLQVNIETRLKAYVLEIKRYE